MTLDEIIGFKKSSKINGLKLDETCRTPNSYFKWRVLIFCEEFVNSESHVLYVIFSSENSYPYRVTCTA